jgi:hypothetical protein
MGQLGVCGDPVITEISGLKMLLIAIVAIMRASPEHAGAFETAVAMGLTD